MKLSTLAAIAALATGWSQVSHAQTLTTGSTATGVGVATAANIIMPGAGAAVPVAAQYSNLGTLANPQFVMGQSTGGNQVNTVDACLKPYNWTLGPGTISGAGVIKMCWAPRMAEAIKINPPGSPGYEMLCTPDEATGNMFLDYDWRSGTIGCQDNKAKLAKTNPNDSRLAGRAPSTVAVVQPVAMVVPVQPAAPQAYKVADNCRIVPGTNAYTCN